MSESAVEIPQVLEVNCTTGEKIMRPMTEAELAQREIDRAYVEASEAERLAAEEAKAAALAAARQELLDLGLSEAAADAIMSQNT